MRLKYKLLSKSISESSLNLFLILSFSKMRKNPLQQLLIHSPNLLEHGKSHLFRVKLRASESRVSFFRKKILGTFEDALTKPNK
jgi:hypothetical protein